MISNPKVQWNKKKKVTRKLIFFLTSRAELGSARLASFAYYEFNPRPPLELVHFAVVLQVDS